MKILDRKLEINGAELAEISKAQDRAHEMVKKYLAKPLQEIEAMGYTRLELACAYLSLAYHALRFGRTKEQADNDFPALSFLICNNVEENIKTQRAKKLH